MRVCPYFWIMLFVNLTLCDGPIKFVYMQLGGGVAAIVISTAAIGMAFLCIQLYLSNKGIL